MQNALIEAANLSFAYRGRNVVEDVSLAADAGELVGLVGPNGSGKTTLLRLLLGSLAPQTGEVLLQGQNPARMERAEIAKLVTLVPQDTRIDAAFTVREIVAMGRTPYLGRFRPASATDEAAIENALRVTALADFGKRLVNELSGGERQRVHLARAVAQETAVVLLDEPTSHLDLTHQLEVLDLIRGLLPAGRCAIAAIHDLNLAARFCDRLLMISQGRVVAAGTPADVLTEAHLQEHFGLVARVREDAETGELLVLPMTAAAKV